MIQSIYELVRRAEENDKAGENKISKYVRFSLRETIEKIDAYLNSKHISGETDSMGRTKPFFNIVTAARNIWFRATDIDRKNIRTRATKRSHYFFAFIADILIKRFMRRAKWGKFLNDWGLTLASYGSAVVKFVEKDQLYSEVIPWQRLIVDPVNFDNNPVIEKHWFTPAQLRKQKDWDQDMVERLIDDVEVRETPDGQKKDTKAEFIEIYEIHGEMPLAYLTDNEEDEDKYQQQVQIVSFTEKKDSNNEYNDYCLYRGREAKSPYMITHLIEQPERTLAIGSVESLFDAQWMENHTKKAIKDQLDLASKLIFQTADGNFVGQNVLNAIENGDILIHADNQPLVPVNNVAADIAALQAFGQEWKNIGNEITGVSEAMLGATPKSGTAWRQTEALLMESHSLFEQMTENKGNYIEEIMREFVIPYIKKQMGNSEELNEILEEHQINKIDSLYIPIKAIKNYNKKIKKMILSGEFLNQDIAEAEYAEQEAKLREALSQLGNQRFIKPSEISSKTWKDVLKDFEWELEIDITGESSDVQSALQTLSMVLQTVGSNPMILEDPRMKLVFNKILSKTGALSPIEISNTEKATGKAPTTQVEAQGAQVAQGGQMGEVGVGQQGV